VKVIRRLSLAAAALVAAAAASAAPAWGQGDVIVGHSGWKWGNPQPQGNTLRQVEFNTGTGYATGEFGTLVRTNDGQNWVGIPTGVRSDIAELQAVDADTVIFGTGCIMRRSDNRGDDFRRVPFVAREQNCPSGVAAFHFPSDQIGYVVLADGSVSQTMDGGQGFGGKREIPGTAAAGGGGAVPADVYFVNDTTGFAVAGGNLFRTTNAAGDWTMEATAPATLRSVVFPDPGTGYAVGDNNTILKSTDGGDTWNPVAVPPDAAGGNLTRVRCANAGACLFSTESGDRILGTTNGGSTVSAVDPGAAPVFAATFANPTAAVGVGQFGATFISPDAGIAFATSTFFPVGPPRLGAGEDIVLSRVRATDSNLVHAPGTRGRVGRSTDAGRTWSTVQVPTAQDITDVSFPDGNTGFAIDTADALRFTSNGGSQWTPIDTGDTPSVNALLALDSNTAMLFTDRGIFRSTAASDTSGGGTTFEPIDNATVRRTGYAEFDRAGQALFAWGSRTLSFSSNRGATWRTVRAPFRRARYRAVDFVSSRQGFVLTTDGRVWTTRNAGRRWAELPATGTNGATDLAFGDARRGYLTIPSWGDDNGGGWVLATSDGGRTWKPELLSSLTLRAGGLEAPAGANAFALGSGDGRGADLFRTDTGGDLGDASTITARPSARRLRRAGTVRVTVQLNPSVSGVPVALFARTGNRWTLVDEGLTTAGRLQVDTRVRRTTRFVAQWFGDANRAGDGSPVTTVTVRR
jgi:photosystem II stability/assembly factor-like uncharacterized protein